MAESGDALLGPERRLASLAVGFSALESATLWGILVGAAALGTSALIATSTLVLGAFATSGVAAGILLARLCSPERRRQRSLEHIRQAMAIHRQLVTQGTRSATVREAEIVVEIALREFAGVDAKALREASQESDRMKAARARKLRVAVEKGEAMEAPDVATDLECDPVTKPSVRAGSPEA